MLYVLLNVLIILIAVAVFPDPTLWYNKSESLFLKWINGINWYDFNDNILFYN